MKVLALWVALGSLALAEELSSEDAFLEADRLISAHIQAFPSDGFQLESPRTKRLDGTQLPYFRQIWAEPLCHGASSPEGLWVGGVDLWVGVTAREGSVRLYRWQGDTLTLLDTSDQSALFRAARGEWGEKHEGYLDLCLDGALEDLTVDEFETDLSRLEIESRHGHIWNCGGGYVEAQVRWLVEGDRLRPLSIEYFAEPLSFSNDSRFWDRSEYRKRDVLRTDTEELVVLRTECSTPWLESLDLLLAVCAGRRPMAAAREIASERQIKALWKYRVLGMSEDSPTVVSRSGTDCEMTCGMSLPLEGGDKERRGIMRFRLKLVDTRWTLVSYAFEEGSTAEIAK